MFRREVSGRDFATKDCVGISDPLAQELEKSHEDCSSHCLLCRRIVCAQSGLNVWANGFRGVVRSGRAATKVVRSLFL